MRDNKSSNSSSSALLVTRVFLKSSNSQFRLASDSCDQFSLPSNVLKELNACRLSLSFILGLNLTTGDGTEFTVFGKITGDILAVVTGITFGLLPCFG